MTTAPDRIACGPILLSTDLDTEHPLRGQLGSEPLVLMVQRGYKAPRFAGLWTLPTGMIEPGETSDDTIAREAMEEFQVIVDPTSTFVHEGVNRGVLIRYYRSRWKPVGDTPTLARSPKGIIENIGFGFFPLVEAIRTGKAHGLVFADALEKLSLS